MSGPLAKTVLNSLSAHIAILDQNGVIVETNRAWKSYARKNRMKEPVDSIGINYLAICDIDGDPGSLRVAEGIRSVLKGEIEEFLYDYPCHSPESKHWYYMRAIRMIYDGPVRVVVSHEDITALKLAQEALKQRERQLEDQKNSLEEANIALKVLLKQREADRLELEETVVANVRRMILPYVQDLKSARLKKREADLINLVDRHLNDIISPFINRLSTAEIFLTPQELQVATLVKDGKSSKEIADILHVSETTVHFHRKNLRKKFGLKNRQTNLRSYLMSLS